MPKIFINYRRQDSEGYTGRLYDRLCEHFDPELIFMDVQNIEGGADFVQVLEDAVAQCDIFLAVISTQWATLADETGERRITQWNDFVAIEIASALKLKKQIIPILVGRAKMPAPSLLPEALQGLVRRNAVELSHQNFRAEVAELAKLIKELAPANESFKRSKNTAQRAEKAEAVKQIRLDLVNASDAPLYAYRTENRLFPVLGDGNPDANIMFIGEAPGKHEAETGKVFTGASGKILDDLLEGIGLKREDVYITNVVMDRPPDKRSPNKAELDYYVRFLDRLITTIAPAVLVTLGQFATDYVLKKLDLPEKGKKISELRGKLIQCRMPYGEIHLVPMLHPAVLAYTPMKREELRTDFEKLRLFV